MKTPCTYVDGIASSQAIDTAGEIVDILGLDCSSLLGGALNWEHKSDVPAQLVGKVLDFKKIFSAQDCESDRQKHYWSKIQMPFLYILGRLFDDEKESSKEVAALFRDDAAHPDEPKMVGFSIEGAKVNKEGMTITRSIARKVTITNMPANKTCEANLVPAQKNSKKGNDLESIFKGEIEFFSPSDKYLEFLQKREQNMDKDDALIGGSLVMSELEKSAPSWTHTGNGNFSHPEHGIVSVAKQPTGEFHVKHNGAMAGMGGQKGSFASAHEAGSHAGNYMRAVSSNKVHAPKMHNMPSASMMGKSMEAGSSNVAPSELTQGAALAKEAPIGRLSPGKDDQKPKQTTSVRIGMGHGSSVSMSSSGSGGSMMMASEKKEKSQWLARAEDAYKSWEKRESFENFMKSKMPHLTKGEIKAIGQTLALKKSLQAEGKLSKMYSSYFGKSKK